VPSIARAVITSKQRTTWSCRASAASTSPSTTPDMQRTDEQIRERGAADAYEVVA
jgi:hypothetical protein